MLGIGERNVDENALEDQEGSHNESGNTDEGYNPVDAGSPVQPKMNNPVGRKKDPIMAGTRRCFCCRSPTLILSGIMYQCR